MGSPLESPQNPEAPGVARPSNLLGDDDRGEPTDREGSMPEPNRQTTQIISRIREIETTLEQLGQSFPAADPHLRKAKDNLRKALQQIVVSGQDQQTASPRMVG